MTQQALMEEVPVLEAEEIKGLFAQPSKSPKEWAVYRYACTFVTPVMFDRMTKEQFLGLITGDKVQYPKDEPMELRAFRKMYSDVYLGDLPGGVLGIPNENFYAALRDTGKKVKYGQGAWDFITSGSAGTKLYSMLRLAEPFIVLRDMDGNPITIERDESGKILPEPAQKHIKVDYRKGNATQGSGAVGIIRSRIDECGFAGHLYLAVSGEYVLPERQLEKLINMAGESAGLCSARPGKNMPFGMFVLRDLTWVGGAKPRQVSVAIDGGTKPKRGRGKGKAVKDEDGNGETATATDPANRISDLLGEGGNGDSSDAGNGDTSGNGNTESGDTAETE